MMARFILAFVILAFSAPMAFGGEQDVYILYKPKPEEEEIRSTYVNEDFTFGFDLPEGYTFIETEIEEGIFNLIIELDDFPLQAAITIEELDEELSAGGYWRQMQDNDPGIEDLLAYERKIDIAGVPGVQVRLEGIQEDGHFLILSVVFTSGVNGYAISAFCGAYYFEEMPDFFQEVTGGFYFLEEEEEEDPPETSEDTEAAAAEPSDAGEESPPE
jgi:hypothetical protein